MQTKQQQFNSLDADIKHITVRQMPDSLYAIGFFV